MVDAREYHERTSHTPRSVREGDGHLDPSTMPRPFKQYRDLPSEPLSSIRPPVQPALASVAHAGADPLARAEQSSRERIDREALATICYESAGVVQRVTAHGGRELFFRAASCTGNLHHVDLYLVCGDLDGLDAGVLASAASQGSGDERSESAGVYHFDPTSFSLDVLREGDYRAALAAAVGVGGSSSTDGATGATDATRTDDATGTDATGTDASGTDASGIDDATEADDAATAVASAPVTVVATSTWARNAWKYGDRTYRHAFWDAGTVLANCLATAHALDYRAEVVADFADDEVATLVGVDPEREAPIAAVPIGAGEPAPADAPPDAPPVEPIDPAIVPPTEDPADTGVIHDAWRQSALADGDAAAAFRRRCRERGRLGARSPPDAGGSPGARSATDAGTAADATLELDPVDPDTASARPLHHAIRRRGSCREYATEGPTRRQVATVLDRALRGVPADWSAIGADGANDADDATDASAHAPLAYNDAYVLATGVDDLTDGTYRLRSDRTALDRLGDVDAATKTHLALDQDWAGAAHVNVYLLADVDAIVETLGDRGYRLAQLEAGIALGRLYLATYAHRDLGGTGLTFYDDLVAQRLAPADSGQTPSEERSDSDEPRLTSFARTPTCLFVFGRRAD